MSVSSVIGVGATILIIAFAAFAMMYSIRNDFAKETIEVLFPAVGAILLSSYLATKAIWVDAPAAHVFGGLVPVFVDREGQLHGVPLPNRNFLPSMDEYRGAELIENLPHYNSFKGISIDSGSAENLIEFAILRWLAGPDLAPGADWSPPRKLLSGGFSGGANPPNLIPITAALEGNPFLAADPVVVRLPPGSVIERLPGHHPSFRIRTRYSALSVTWRGTTLNSVISPINEEQKKIQFAMASPSQSLIGGNLYGYDVRFEFSQNSFTRFSRQAKTEASWSSYIAKQFERDFAWEHFRDQALRH